MSFGPYWYMIGAGMRPFLPDSAGGDRDSCLLIAAQCGQFVSSPPRQFKRERDCVRVDDGGFSPRMCVNAYGKPVECLAGGTLGLRWPTRLGSCLSMAPKIWPRIRARSDATAEFLNFTLLISILYGRGVWELRRENNFFFFFFFFMFFFFSFFLFFFFFANKDQSAQRLKRRKKEKEGPARGRTREAAARMVIGEFGVSLVLLTGAGLMIATFERLLTTSPGFMRITFSRCNLADRVEYNSTREI